MDTEREPLVESSGSQGREANPSVGPRIGSKQLLPTDVGELHLLVGELQDDRASGRMREAMWISIIVHLVLFLLFLLSPRIFPNGWARSTVSLAPPQEKNPVFLELPADAQKMLKRQRTNILSDKNRIAESRNPIPNQPSIEELERMRRQGAPGLRGQRPQPTPREGQQATPPQQTQATQQQPQQQPQQQNTQAQLQQPQQTPRPNPFGTPQSAGTAIQDALRAAANGRGAGQEGDYGEGIRPHAGMQGNLEVLSDTQGVDFGPYLSRVVSSVRRNWYTLIPEEAMPPLNRTGRVIIEFSILKNGGLGPLTIRDGSGAPALDHAAKGGIVASNPFPPLPGEYKGEDLKLRFYFFYLGPNGKVQ